MHIYGNISFLDDEVNFELMHSYYLTVTELFSFKYKEMILNLKKIKRTCIYKEKQF